MLTFFWYPNCGTCKKAKKWLDNHQVNYKPIHIVQNPPNKEDILELMQKSGMPARKFFNTSGKKYRELNMKEKIADATEEEMAEILASDGMLIKRPIVTDGSNVTVGFKEEEFEKNWL
ncbi:MULTISPECIES: arsenate reductase family protein [Virgibacillus]|uniref:Arsenate reductase family protein n=1 Tax=Virgibacillus dokdonensis TaxID=302167 RepID=A0A2K9IWP5_9BACI|nr:MULTISPECIES: arsenate reductase family protein [Virgibacillus]AUJ23173.1 Regulatory protein MgsR [Virgibacillus dokdonensis]NWO13364.1 arsenate reductase family protein [Virgibacillus sp.]